MNTTIDSIVLDLDDTLNSLSLHILHCLGCDVGPFDYHKFPTECSYDIIAAHAKLSGRKEPIPVPMFWEMVSRRTWESAPRSHQFWLIEQAASLVGEENVLLATAPVKSPDCHYAKYQWIENHLPKWMQRQYNITPRKHRLSRPGVLLIDDSDHNVEKFRNPGWPGGDAILVPRPWNTLVGVHTSSYLAEELGKREYVFCAEKSHTREGMYCEG